MPLSQKIQPLNVPYNQIRESLKKQIAIPSGDIEIITDPDIVALGTVYVLLPPFKPLSHLGQVNCRKILGLPLVNVVCCKIKCDNNSSKEINLNELLSS